MLALSVPFLGGREFLLHEHLHDHVLSENFHGKNISE